MNVEEELERSYYNGIKNLTKLLLLLRKYHEKGLNYKEIGRKIPNKKFNTPNEKSNIHSLLESLTTLLDIEALDHDKERCQKEYRLNHKGQEIADNILYRLLNSDERKLVVFLKEKKNFRCKNLHKDFWDIVNLFYNHAFNQNAEMFSEMLRDMMTQIRKFFKYEVEFRLDKEQARA